MQTSGKAPSIRMMENRIADLERVMRGLMDAINSVPENVRYKSGLYSIHAMNEAEDLLSGNRQYKP